MSAPRNITLQRLITWQYTLRLLSSFSVSLLLPQNLERCPSGRKQLLHDAADLVGVGFGLQTAKQGYGVGIVEHFDDRRQQPLIDAEFFAGRGTNRNDAGEVAFHLLAGRG